MSDKQENQPLLPGRRRLLLSMGALTGATLTGITRVQAADQGLASSAPTSDLLDQSNPFHGLHQQGVVNPRPAAGMLVAFDVLASDRQELERLLRTLTERARFLMTGGKVPDVDPKLPPLDSGILGPEVTPDNLTITLSVGASLFDDRFGLKNLKPKRLQRMVEFPNDALQADLCHGDLSIQFCANTPDTNIHALRDIVKHLPDLLMVRWKQEGTVPVTAAKPGTPAQSARNFLGFRDGSANPDSTDNDLMRQVVWVQPGGDEPAWAAHGSYQAVRLIRNFVERWDRTPLQEQQTIFGRKKDSGAPLDGGDNEFETPNYAADPQGKKIPLDAHMRLANPRTPASAANLLLRRAFNYSNGVNKNGQLDMGLLFIAYQADLEKGFITVQNRLNGEPLEEYLKPFGGGYFFTLPGVADEQDYFGRGLLTAAG